MSFKGAEWSFAISCPRPKPPPLNISLGSRNFHKSENYGTILTVLPCNVSVSTYHRSRSLGGGGGSYDFAGRAMKRTWQRLVPVETFTSLIHCKRRSWSFLFVRVVFRSARQIKLSSNSQSWDAPHMRDELEAHRSHSQHWFVIPYRPEHLTGKYQWT